MTPYELDALKKRAQEKAAKARELKEDLRRATEAHHTAALRVAAAEGISGCATLEARQAARDYDMACRVSRGDA